MMSGGQSAQSDSLGAGGRDTAVLHIGMNLMTGPWAVARELALAQHRSGRYAVVAIGAITDKSWPPHYAQEMESLGLPYYRKEFPLMPFGTASVLYQVVRRPGIERWVSDLAAKCGARRVIVHSHNAWLSGVYLPLRRVASVEVSFVATFHGVNIQLKDQPVRRRIHRWMAQRLPRYGARLVSVDAFNVPLAREVFGLKEGLFTVIHNGTAPTDRRACPYLHGAECFVVGHVGNMIERKGWRITAEAVVRLARSGKRVRTIIAGSGADEEEARQFAGSHPGVVEFVGQVPDARHTVMPQLDLLSMMSVHEGFPMSIIEAMAVGLPVVSTNVGGVSEAVSDGTTGLFIERSVDALAAVIERLMADRPLLARLSENSIVRFREEFDISQVVQQYDRVYQANHPHTA
jgi:glycosyltransferase involved in cell wall biosynthesis